MQPFDFQDHKLALNSHLSENRNIFPVEKKGVLRGSQGLASRTALRSAFFISDTFIAEIE